MSFPEKIYHTVKEIEVQTSQLKNNLNPTKMFNEKTNESSPDYFKHV